MHTESSQRTIENSGTAMQSGAGQAEVVLLGSQTVLPEQELAEELAQSIPVNVKTNNYSF